MREVYIGKSLAQLDVEDQRAWRIWFQQMGIIDWHNIPLYSTIYCDDEKREVSYQVYVKDINGKAVLTPDRTRLQIAHRYVQLEGVAMPIPPGQT